MGWFKKILGIEEMERLNAEMEQLEEEQRQAVNEYREASANLVKALAEHGGIQMLQCGKCGALYVARNGPICGCKRYAMGG